MRYDNKYFFSVRKPHGIPSTFGQQASFLEQLIAKRSPQILELERNRITSLKDGIRLETKENPRELGLINRLDNETAGLLFFAKNQNIYNQYKQLQNQMSVSKIYYADLQGKLSIINSEFGIEHGKLRIDKCIYHHYSDNTRMTLDENIGRNKGHKVITCIEPLYYDSYLDRTTCRIIIQKGIRHQIRIHTASIGHPIVNDTLYAPKLYKQNQGEIIGIHLRSMGIEIN